MINMKFLSAISIFTAIMCSSTLANKCPVLNNDQIQKLIREGHYIDKEGNFLDRKSYFIREYDFGEKYKLNYEVSKKVAKKITIKNGKLKEDTAEALPNNLKEPSSLKICNYEATVSEQIKTDSNNADNNNTHYNLAFFNQTITIPVEVSKVERISRPSDCPDLTNDEIQTLIKKKHYKDKSNNVLILEDANVTFIPKPGVKKIVVLRFDQNLKNFIITDGKKISKPILSTVKSYVDYPDACKYEARISKIQEQTDKLFDAFINKPIQIYAKNRKAFGPYEGNCPVFSSDEIIDLIKDGKVNDADERTWYREKVGVFEHDGQRIDEYPPALYSEINILDFVSSFGEQRDPSGFCTYQAQISALPNHTTPKFVNKNVRVRTWMRK
ncbi:MAG: hypothetical protein FJX03_01920 [Alphaproteobacteria bacterium]|nr:hypothetical protein [Alphaproteobacteria bacterium]